MIDIRTQTVDVESQETITRDSVTLRVNAVLWFRVNDSAKAVVNVADFRAAVYQIALTSLRNIIGQHGLDEVLNDRNAINLQIRKNVDQTTEPWGVEIEMVEIKDVDLPESLQRAMAREAEAIREKRARLIKAEAEFEASVKLTEAAQLMTSSPAALELRRMQMMSEIGAENNSLTLVLMPSEFVQMAGALGQAFGRPALSAGTPAPVRETNGAAIG
jgi:regulator of protease activity HflC (stomatin/prohibitin superfamily)